MKSNPITQIIIKTLQSREIFKITKHNQPHHSTSKVFTKSQQSLYADSTSTDFA